MRNLYYISLFFCILLFMSSIGIVVAMFTLISPSAEMLGCLCIIFAIGMLGSYGYYLNLIELKNKIKKDLNESF